MKRITITHSIPCSQCDHFAVFAYITENGHHSIEVIDTRCADHALADEQAHGAGCVCADCSGADLTADND